MQVLGVWESCEARWRIPCQSRSVRGAASCPAHAESQARLLWGPGLSAAAIRPNDAVCSGAGNAHGMSPAADPRWPGRALGSQAPPAFCRGLCSVLAVLRVPGCPHRDPPLLCCCREEGRCWNSRRMSLSRLQPSFLIVCKTSSAACRRLTETQWGGWSRDTLGVE